MPEARSWRDTPPRVAGHGTGFHNGGRGMSPVTEETDFQLAYWLPGNQQRGMPLTAPLIRYHGGEVPPWDYIH